MSRYDYTHFLKLFKTKLRLKKSNKMRTASSTIKLEKQRLMSKL